MTYIRFPFLVILICKSCLCYFSMNAYPTHDQAAWMRMGKYFQFLQWCFHAWNFSFFAMHIPVEEGLCFSAGMNNSAAEICFFSLIYSWASLSCPLKLNGTNNICNCLHSELFVSCLCQCSDFNMASKI